MKERDFWIDDLELYTEPMRHARAARHNQIAIKAIAVDNQTTARWHSCRARGQRERFQRVRMCGTEAVRIHCGGCGRLHRQDPNRCGQHRVCPSCRGRRAYLYRRRFNRAHELALRKYAPEIAGKHGRPWREIFLTLTYPKTGDAARDVEAIYKAWPRFIRRIRNYLQRERGAGGDEAERILQSPWFRVVEITPGTDDRGHAHLHAWLLLPFIHHSIVRAFWARSLDADAQERIPMRDATEVMAAGHPRDKAEIERATMVRAGGRRRDQIPWPVVDIRKAHSDPGSELIKYLVKDQHHGKLVASETFAPLFDALEGRRVAVTSRYFWTQAEAPAACHCCGVAGDWRVEVDSNVYEGVEMKPLARAPPDRATALAVAAIA